MTVLIYSHSGFQKLVATGRHLVVGSLVHRAGAVNDALTHWVKGALRRQCHIFESPLRKNFLHRCSILKQFALVQNVGSFDVCCRTPGGSIFGRRQQVTGTTHELI